MTCLVSLLEKLKKKPDQTAWKALVDGHGTELYVIALGILGDKHLAEDATQNTLLAIRDSVSAFHITNEYPEARAYAWIRRIACLQSLQLLRSHDSICKREILTTHQPKSFLGPEENIMHKEMTNQVRMALADMPEHQRQPLVLVYYGGLNNQDLALELKCSPGAARTRLHRCLKSLQKRLLRVGISCTLASVTAHMHAASGTINSTLLVSWNGLLASSQTATVVPIVALQGVTLMTKIALTCVASLIVGTTALSIGFLTGEESGENSLNIKNEEPVTTPTHSTNNDLPLHEKLQKKVALNFNEVTLENAIGFIEKNADITFVWSHKQNILENTPPLSLSIQDIKVKTALNYIALLSDITIRQEGEVLKIELTNQDAQSGFFAHAQLPHTDTLSPKEREHKLSHPVSLSLVDVNIIDCVAWLKNMTGQNFLLTADSDALENQTVTLHVENESLGSVLDTITRQTGLTYTVKREVIEITKKEAPVNQDG